MLRCEECESPATERAEGWVAFRVEDEEGGEPFVVVYCPRCAERELELS